MTATSVPFLWQHLAQQSIHTTCRRLIW